MKKALKAFFPAVRLLGFLALRLLVFLAGVLVCAALARKLLPTDIVQSEDWLLIMIWLIIIGAPVFLALPFLSRKNRNALVLFGFGLWLAGAWDHFSEDTRSSINLLGLFVLLVAAIALGVSIGMRREPVAWYRFIFGDNDKGKNSGDKTMGDEFKVGDVVQLKSGGPKMTIEGIGPYGADHDRATCVWFEKTERKVNVFEFAMLKKVEG